MKNLTSGTGDSSLRFGMTGEHPGSDDAPLWIPAFAGMTILTLGMTAYTRGFLATLRNDGRTPRFRQRAMSIPLAPLRSAKGGIIL